MSSLNDQNLATDHGNPLIVLPAAHSGGRVMVVHPSSRSPLWVSHGFSTDRQAVRVDVWQGRFTASATGWSVLAAGRYEVAWVGSDPSSPGAPLAMINVAADRLFDTSFIPTDRNPSEMTHDRLHPAWEIRPDDMDGYTSAYCAGAMHGVFHATFEHQAHPCGSARPRFGLVARYYNRFHHMRLSCTLEGANWVFRLLRLANQPPDLESALVLAECSISSAGNLFFAPGASLKIQWDMNGNRHDIRVNDQPLLSARDNYMGGVDVVGWFASDGVACARAAMDTTQSVARFTIVRPAYRADIRAGNIDRLFLRQSAEPDRNICWESGIQFGHIGGSEIKFTQSADLRLIEDGPVATTVAWDGPMPKFSEQADDVRGQARGLASFYPDRIVIADEVLAWTSRSVGPDIDLLGRLLAGPAKVAVGDAGRFEDWTLPADGSFANLSSAHGHFPAAVAFPLQLGNQTWWLLALILPRNIRAGQSTSVFGWQCPSGLTASHDFRCAPTTPSQEYCFTIVLQWRQNDSVQAMESTLPGATLLALRDAWLNPMRVNALHGSIVTYPNPHDQPAEAMDLLGCFDPRTGRYIVRASDGMVKLRLHPNNIAHREVVLAIRNWRVGSAVVCLLDGVTLQAGRDWTGQEAAGSEGGELWLLIHRPIERSSVLEIRSQDLPL
ncbi:MAG: hypothetical protein IT446_16090 [Phycisphaerales bacterium]|nr:hypothetical protein [Phycisphaerales bacterium]